MVKVTCQGQLEFGGEIGKNMFLDWNFQIYYLIFINMAQVPGRVAQSVACLATDASLTADPGVAS